MSKILLITDVSRIGKIFGQLAVDNSVQVSIANNLEQGGKILAAETPDAVYVQTHLSGLSADILLLHLKNQLGGKLTSFFLLATPNQVNNTILAPFQGWLDTSKEDEQVYRNLLLQLSRIISNWNRNNFANNDLLAAANLQSVPVVQQSDVSNIVPANEIRPDLIESSPIPPTAHTTENYIDQEPTGSYPSNARLSVYSEFNSTFDSAVTTTPEPAPVANSAPPDVDSWLTGHQEPPALSARSKRLSFLIWLVPVIVLAVVFTVFQHFGRDRISSVLPEPLKSILFPATSTQVTFNNHSTSSKAKAVHNISTSVKKPASGNTSHAVPEKTVTAEVKEHKPDKPALPEGTVRPSKLPELITRNRHDKSFSGSNPGWDRYASDTLEYRIYREQSGIKAIQLISAGGGTDLGGSFLLDVFKQLNIRGNFVTEAAETKEGFKIERGQNGDGTRVIYYRNKDDSRLHAVVITWK